MGVPKSVGGRRKRVGLSERGDGGSDVGGENGSHASSPAEARVNPRALAAATSIAATRLAGEPASALRFAGRVSAVNEAAGATDDMKRWSNSGAVRPSINTAAPGHKWILSRGLEVTVSRSGHSKGTLMNSRGYSLPPLLKPQNPRQRTQNINTL